jgi:myosin-5
MDPYPAMQIQYNITRIEEWCKSHDMPEGTLQLEHLMQATKLLQLKKVRAISLSASYINSIMASRRLLLT